MKISILLAFMAFSLNAFTQTQYSTTALKLLNANSIHNSARQHQHAQSLSNTGQITQQQSMVIHPSREIFDLIPLFDSIYMWGWDSLGSKLALESKITDFQYNADNFPTSLTLQTWTGSAWMNQFLFLYTYDANNNQTSLLFRSWNGIAFTNFSQTLYTYDANNNQTSELSQYWTGSAWMNNVYYIYTYDGNNNQLTETDQQWDGTAWLNYGKTTYVYSGNNDETSDLFQTWDDLNGVWINSSQSLYTYDGNHNLLTGTYQTWNGVTWDNVYLTINTYDGNNNRVSELNQSWDGAAWMNIYKVVYTYDGNHNVTNSLTQNWNGAGWDNASRETNTYNSNHLITKSIDDIWDGSTWLHTTVSVYTYDGNNIVSGEGSRTFDSTGNFVDSGDSSHFYFTTTISATKDLSSEDGSVILYPNPNNGIFTVSTKSALSQIEVFNSIGERVYSVKNINDKTTSEINLSGYAKGTYMVVMKNGNHVTSRKILIQ